MGSQNGRLDGMTNDLVIVPSHRTGDLELAASVERMVDRIRRAPAANTTAAYDRQWAAFERWCARYDIQALPAQPAALALYVSYLADLNRAPATIEQALVAIRVRHRDAGHKDQPDADRAQDVLRTYKRDRAEAGHRKRQAPAVTLRPLRAMIEACDTSTMIGLRDRALVVLGFALFGRRSEMTALRMSDVRFTDNGLVVHIAMSKTDKDSAGEDVQIPPGSHPDTDPVRVLRAYLDALAERGITEGRLLRSVDRWGRVGESLSPSAVSDTVRKLAVAAGLPGAETFTAHGLRAGGPTEAAMNGVPTAVIAEHGRWSKNSTQVLTYVRNADKWRNNPLNGMGL